MLYLLCENVAIKHIELNNTNVLEQIIIYFLNKAHFIIAKSN